MQIADKNPQDELSFWDHSPERLLPVIQGQQAEGHRPLPLGFRGSRIGGSMPRMLYPFWNIIRETTLQVTHYFRVRGDWGQRAPSSGARYGASDCAYDYIILFIAFVWY